MKTLSYAALAALALVLVAQGVAAGAEHYGRRPRCRRGEL